MWLIDELITALVQRNAVKLKGSVTIGLTDGGVTVFGEVRTTINDTQKGKAIATMVTPVNVTMSVGETVSPVRFPR